MPTLQEEHATCLLTRDLWITIEDFYHYIHRGCFLHIEENALNRLKKTRRFIDFLLENKRKVYGLTTGFADLRNTNVSAPEAAQLSVNILLSHDAGIGPSLPRDVTLGAMLLRAISLSRGYSGFSPEGLSTLTEMIHAQIIPEIPSTGSLGASGDLAFLARLGRAMMGEDVAVSYQGNTMTARKALALARISPLQPQAKEGLALTNGTSFMASMLAIGYAQEQNFLKNLFPLLGLFLNTVDAVDAAFHPPIHQVRQQRGQQVVAKILQTYLSKPSGKEVQNDYSIRCLPQILGPKLEAIIDQREKIEKELNAVTDNPLLFSEEEISPSVDPCWTYMFEGEKWAVLSGGNFHGESSATVADALAIANVKIALTLERQLTYLLNPFRNQGILPIYLVTSPDRVGLQSGFMIAQYTANALAHKIALLASPATVHNITSANESEDIVSYGATAAHKLLQQQSLLEELLSIFLITTCQAYSLVQPHKKERNALCEELFSIVTKTLPFPEREDLGFDTRWEMAKNILASGCLHQDACCQNISSME